MSDYSELERRAQAAIDAIGTLSRARQERAVSYTHLTLPTICSV